MTDQSRPLVLHVVYRFDVGGLENGVVNLINRMPETHFRHAVLALTECVPTFCERVTRPDVELLSLHKAPGHSIKLYPELYRIFASRRPAIVHTRNLAALEAQVPAWFAGVRGRVHGEHGWDMSDPHGQNRKFRLMRRLYSPFVRRYVALSGHLADYLTGPVGIDARRVARICNGVDTQRFSPASDVEDAFPDAPFRRAGHCIFGTVGRLQAVKDQLNLVRAFALARQSGGEIGQRMRLVIAGEGPLRGEIEAVIRDEALSEFVWLAGERKDVPNVMRGLDVFVLPSKAEGISNTVLEAMASGLPVLATAVGGNSELVVEGDTGALVPAQDSAAMALALLDYAADAALCRRQGVAGRTRAVEHFSLDGMVQRYVELYSAVLS